MRFLEYLDTFFDKIYSSKYNPFYRSGTLTVGLLAIVIITGIYLIFFYQVEAPYESLVKIENEVFLGSLMRAIHRYASDAALIATFFHVLRLIVEGKTWGPRTLAWVSGVILMVVLYISAATGFVMVWDLFGQMFVLAGARMIDLFPFFPVPQVMTFSGHKELPPSFFFINLFLHVALPLAMIFGIWIHTAKIARSRWFPIKPIFIFLTLGFIILGLIWRAPLEQKADFLLLPGPVKSDFFYGFWLPLSQKSSALWSALFWGFLFIFFISIPWWLRPKKNIRDQKSKDNPLTCLGCEQCSKDCPYEAIEMVPRRQGKGSPIVAQVIRDNCVVCGLCSGSCSTYSIGPNERSGREQLARMRELIEHSVQIKSGAVIFCINNSSMEEKFKKVIDLPLFPIPCVGDLHPRVVELLQKKFKKLYIISCPERNCRSKEGPYLLKERLFNSRPPSDSSKLDIKNLTVIEASVAEFSMIKNIILEEGELQKNHNNISLKVFMRLFCSMLLFLSIAFLSGIQLGDSQHEVSHLRISFRLSGQKKEMCRKHSPEELHKIPVHMRTPEICERILLSYLLNINIDGQEIMQKKISPPGARGDRPLIVNEEMTLPTTTHNIQLSFQPIESDTGKRMYLNQDVKFTPSRVVLITLENDEFKVFK